MSDPPTITRLKLAGRGGARTLVEVDGEPWEEVLTEAAVLRGLSKGMAFPLAAQTELLRENAFIACRSAAARALHVRARGREELRRWLRARRYDEAAVERVIAYFEDKGDLDDAAFAVRFVRSGLKQRSVGPAKVGRKLLALGVAPDLVERALAGAEDASETEQRTRVRRLLERRAARLRETHPMKRRRKLMDATLRAGFDPDLVRPLLDEFAGPEPFEDA